MRVVHGHRVPPVAWQELAVVLVAVAPFVVLFLTAAYRLLW